LKRRILVILLAGLVFTTNMSVIGERKIEELGDGYYRYVNDFNASKQFIINDTLLAFNNENNFQFKDGVISIEGDTWALFTTSQLLGEKPYTVTMDVMSKEVNPAATCGAAFNVRAKKASTFMDQGITFMVRNKSLRVFMKTRELAHIQLPFSFADEMRKVYIEDNLDLIRFHADDDNGKVLLAEVELTEERVTVKDNKGKQKGNAKRENVPDTGFFGFMSHFAKTTVDNFSFEYYIDQYEPADMSNFWDTYYDTWVATDDLERTLPVTYTNTVKKNKKVGIFYFLWHDRNGGPLFDHYAAYLEGGIDKVWDIIKQGDEGYGHYWAEPYFGYYRSDDEWVIRKHTTMLVNAGIDFIYFDMSNGHIYEHVLTKILGTWKQMREEGLKTPEFVCFLGDRTDLGYKTAMDVWNTVYQHGIYRDMYFMWDGKPLLLGNLAEVPDEIKENFTIRRSWAFTDWDWYTESDGKGKWPWIALHPQGPGKSFEGIIEQVIVSCGFHSNSSSGRSFHNGQQPTDGKNAFEFELETTPLGLAFKEQWEHALKINPPIVMVTGWNEWWAGRWPNAGEGQKIANTYTITKDHPDYMHNYVDCFNPEFSRDIEPMKYGFGDNYYYQMVSYIRQFKGARPLPTATKPKTITINNDFSQWDDVGPEFRDTINDTKHRDFPGNASGLHYTNTTGRNDIVSAKVARDQDYIYFLVTTKEDITAPEGENWMNLYIDADQNFNTGWKGYDYVINRSRTENTVSVEKSVDNSYVWEIIHDAEYIISGNNLHLRIPLSVLNLTTDSSFDFKWADNSTTTGEIMEFMDKGDAAPDDRFNFRFVASAPVDNISETAIIIIAAASVAAVIIVIAVLLARRNRIEKVK
jgi:hypothetical protein